jgi:hypothetical protein
MPIWRGIVLDPAHERIGPSLQRLDHFREWALVVGVRGIDLDIHFGCKVLPEGPRCWSDGDVLGNVLVGRAIEKLGHGGGAEIPWVADGLADTVVDIFGVATIVERSVSAIFEVRKVFEALLTQLESQVCFRLNLL